MLKKYIRGIVDEWLDEYVTELASRITKKTEASFNQLRVHSDARYNTLLKTQKTFHESNTRYATQSRDGLEHSLRNMESKFRDLHRKYRGIVQGLEIKAKVAEKMSNQAIDYSIEARIAANKPQRMIMTDGLSPHTSIEEFADYLPVDQEEINDPVEEHLAKSGEVEANSKAETSRAEGYLDSEQKAVATAQAILAKEAKMEAEMDKGRDHVGFEVEDMPVPEKPKGKVSG